jgi:hypothetical protein
LLDFLLLDFHTFTSCQIMIVSLIAILGVCVATITTGDSTNRSRRRRIAEVDDDNVDALSVAAGDDTEEAPQPRAPYFFIGQGVPPFKDHPILCDKNGILYHDYTKEQMRALAENPNARSWELKVLCRHVGISGRGTQAEIKANLLAYCNDEKVRRGFRIIGNADPNARSTFFSEQYESGEHNLVGYHADQIEANGGTFLHRLLNL